MLTTRRRTQYWALLAAVGLLLAAGCGSDAKPESTESSKVKNVAPRSTEDPGASTKLIESLRKSKRGSLDHAIFSLYYYARWGNYPSLVRLYDSEVRSAIGRHRIASIYSDNRGRFLSVGVPKIVDTQRGAEGATLAVELQPTEGEVIQESYLLRPRKGGWGIAYDTFFDRAYGEAARVVIDGPSGKASARGTQAARRASEKFRGLFLPE